MRKTGTGLALLLFGMGLCVPSLATEDAIVRTPSALKRRLVTTDAPTYDEHYTDDQATETKNRAPASETPSAKTPMDESAAPPPESAPTDSAVPAQPGTP